MGSIALPAAGDVYLDSNCFIYSGERVDPYDALLTPVWDASRTGKIRIVTSELTRLEVLVQPVRLGDAHLEALYRGMLKSSRDLSLVPISSAVLERALTLRATQGFKTPDAIHAATALITGCKLLVSNDPAFRRLSGIQVEILSDLK